MGFFSKLLEFITNNYILFQIVTIFLIFSLIGYLADKKARQNNEVTPIFGSKVSLNKGNLSFFKNKTGKKGKKSFFSGSESKKKSIINTLSSTSASINDLVNQKTDDAQELLASADASYTSGNTTENPAGGFNYGVAAVSDDNFMTTGGQMVVPNATSAQISDTVLPNVATTSASSVQGFSTAAPEMSSIVPEVETTPKEESSSSPKRFFHSNVNSNSEFTSGDDSMNLNMNE